MNAFTEAFALGSKVGSHLRERQAQNALSSYIGAMPQQGGIVATPEQQEASRKAEQVLLRASPELYLKARTLSVQSQKAQADQVAAQRKAQNDQLPVQINMLRSANPENWQSLRSEAIRRGFGSEQTLPVQFDQGWRDSQLGILQSFQENPDILTNDIKNVMAGLPAENRDINDPVFRQAFRRSQERVINNVPGGSSLAYDSYSGTARPLVAPNPGGFAPGTPAAQPSISNTPAPQMGANGNPVALDERQYQAVVNVRGKDATDAWMARHNIPLAKKVNGVTAYRINGKWYDNPEGR